MHQLREAAASFYTAPSSSLYLRLCGSRRCCQLSTNEVLGGPARVGASFNSRSQAGRLNITSRNLHHIRDVRKSQIRSWIPATKAISSGSALLACIRLRNMNVSTTSRRTVPKEVVVVGAGPTGLATAFLLASQGHKVTVLERKKEYRAGPGSIQIPVNGSSLLVKWGLEEAFQAVASKKRLMYMQRYDNLETLYTTVTESGSAYVSLASD